MLLLGVMFSGNPRPILLVLLRHIETVFFSLDGGRRFTTVEQKLPHLDSVLNFTAILSCKMFLIFQPNKKKIWICKIYFGFT